MHLHPALCCMAALAATLCGPAAAIGLGQVDNFEDGSTQGWGSGAANAAPPANVASGGPAGAGDNYLLVTSSGIRGPGGKLVALSGAQWSGDYLAAGITAISMDLSNLGSSDLSLHLLLAGSGGASAITTQPLLLPAGSGWTHLSFNLAPAALTGPALQALGGVTQLRLFHGDAAVFPGPDIAAQLGVDNITAVPEPRSAALLLAGLAALAARRRRTPR
jgi:hypothetical protein